MRKSVIRIGCFLFISGMILGMSRNEVKAAGQGSCLEQSFQLSEDEEDWEEDDEDEEFDETLWYQQQGFEIEKGVLKQYSGTAEEVVVPDSVTSIGKMAFSGCKNVKKIVLPTSVTRIEAEALMGCSNLESLSVQGSLSYFGINACRNLKKLEKVEFASGTSEISAGAFSNCTSLTVVELPSTITRIGNNAFNNCSSLSSIELPANVSQIDSGAFEQCSKLTSIVVPASVTSLDEKAFNECTSLTSVTLQKGLESIGVYAFGQCSSLKELVIPESVTQLSEHSFYQCTSLTSMEVPAGITTLPKGVFQECDHLASIKVPESITEIGENAFRGCSVLEEIEVPEKLEVIGAGAFSNCKALKSFIITKGVTSVGKNSFKGCSSLVYLIIDSESCSFENAASLNKVILCIPNLTKENINIMTQLDQPYYKQKGVLLYPVSFLMQGDKVSLAVTKGETVSFSSSDSKVATVSNAGVVKAKKNGKTTITATVDGKDYSCTIQVNGEKGDSTVKVDQIIEHIILDGMSDYEKAKQAFDWMENNISYDYSYKGYGMADAVIEKCCVCDGYAAAFKGFMDALDIPCKLVIGTASGSKSGVAGWYGHAWNMVKIHSKWYHVDATWGVDYFLKTDAYMKEYVHKWGSSYPSCTSTTIDKDYCSK